MRVYKVHSFLMSAGRHGTPRVEHEIRSEDNPRELCSNHWRWREDRDDVLPCLGLGGVVLGGFVAEPNAMPRSGSGR